MGAVATAYLALGSNLGDRATFLRSAIERLGPVVASPVVETDAVADEPQPPYLNQVIRIETALSPRALLDRCLEIEAELGRVRPGARTLDIDLLLYDQEIINEPDLVLPHPRMLERTFVRVPLAAVATPGLRHPVTGERLDRFDGKAATGRGRTPG